MPQEERKDNFFCSQFVIGAKAGQDRRLLLLTRPPCMVLKIVDFACYLFCWKILNVNQNLLRRRLAKKGITLN